MTTRDLTIHHRLTGGWATDFGVSLNTAPNRAGVLEMPFLQKAEDCIFSLDGGILLIDGTSKVNSSALESGAAVKGVFDAWLHGSSGTPAQHRIAHVGTKIVEDDADGTFADLFTGLETDKVPDYAMMNDLVVMCSDSTADVPKSWDGSTAQDLAGTPPNFSMVVEHKNRLWAAGVVSTPSTVYYTVLDDPEDWVGSGSGNIVISNDDGDRITGLASHRNNLWIFKGPYKGSISRIIGSAPTGTDAFARVSQVTGIGAAGPNMIFPFRGDLGFVASDGTVHSLKATDAFGDFEQAALSRNINSWLRRYVNRSRLAHGWAVDQSDEGRVYISLPIYSNNDPNIVLVMDYRFEPPWWSQAPSFDTAAVSLATSVNASDNNRRTILAGGSDGFVRFMGQRRRSIDGDDAFNYHWQTPYMTYGTPWEMKTLAGVLLSLTPFNSGNITFGVKRDNNSEATVLISQAGPDAVLGPATNGNDFTLDTSTLGGGRFIYQPDRLGEEGGEFRSVAFSAQLSTLNEDVHIHDFLASGTIDDRNWETA